MNIKNNEIVIVGGGYYGLYLAYALGRQHYKVTVLEASEELMGRASYNNQARVHNGYHYPRSVLTAMRSRVSFPRFVADFPDCIASDFEKYYGIGRPLGKVSAYQFKRFCERIGAEIDEAPERIKRLVNPRHIEALFSVREYAFDSHKLRDTLLKRLASLPVTIKTGVEVDSVCHEGLSSEELIVKARAGAEEKSYRANHVFNCAYSRINFVLTKSGLQAIPLKHEMTEMCLVTVPEPIRNLGLTVMCGPFFSVMPFPCVQHCGERVHSFSHVRYTPHYEWHDDAAPDRYEDPYWKFRQAERFSAWEYMRKDAERYVPCLSECRYLDSLWEVKTVLPRSEVDDSRPILCRFDYGIRGLHCVMGGKIDNTYDVVDAVYEHLGIQP